MDWRDAGGATGVSGFLAAGGRAPGGVVAGRSCFTVCFAQMWYEPVWIAGCAVDGIGSWLDEPSVSWM